ncbi:hypothetical protein ACFV0T_03615 [Streptomyces sp. NPDC059582]|uniref:hypothetical protein n=1 Tax=Streptomyces sp. NPDC059582 TaxID=3346875 RepID=UPI0036CDD20A
MALLVGLTAALTAASCGVPPSDVIEAGAPASGPASPEPSAPAAVPFYFLRNGDLKPYPRKVGDPGNFGAVVSLLFDGPTRGEAVTATTRLPRLTKAPDVTLGGDNTFSVRLLEDVPPLSHLAMLQLACTVAQLSYNPVPANADPTGAGDSAAPADPALHSAAPTSVRVLGNGWTMTQSNDSCPKPLQP